MEKQTIVPVPLEFLEELQRTLDKAKSTQAAPYAAGLANGMLSALIGAVKNNTKEETH